MPPSPSSIHWKGIPQHYLPRISYISSQSLLQLNPSAHAAALNVVLRPLGANLDKAREEQRRRIKRHRLRRSYSTVSTVTWRRPRIRDAPTSTSPRPLVQRVQRRRTPRHSVVFSHPASRVFTPRPRLRRSSGSAKRGRRSLQVRFTSSRNSPTSSIRMRSRRPSEIIRQALITAPPPWSWGIIPDTADRPLNRVNTIRDTQLFKRNARRVSGQYRHKPRSPRVVPRVTPQLLDQVRRENTETGPRVYDPRLPVKGKPRRVDRSQPRYTILRKLQEEVEGSRSSLELTRVKGSSEASSDLVNMYGPGRASNEVEAGSRTDSERGAVNDFTKGLEAHLAQIRNQSALQEPAWNRTKSPSVATTTSAHTLQQFLPFRNELIAAGLAVTSKEQRTPSSNPVSTSDNGRRVHARDESATGSEEPSWGGSAREAPYSSSHQPASSAGFRGPGSMSPALLSSTASYPTTVVAFNDDIPAPKRTRISPRNQHASKKILPWLHKSDTNYMGKTNPLMEVRFLDSPAPSDDTGRTSATTVIDFTPHPAEAAVQSFNFDVSHIRQQYPDLDLDSASIYTDMESGQVFIADRNDSEKVPRVILEDTSRSTAIEVPQTDDNSDKPRAKQRRNSNVSVIDYAIGPPARQIHEKPAKSKRPQTITEASSEYSLSLPGSPDNGTIFTMDEEDDHISRYTSRRPVPYEEQRSAFDVKKVTPWEAADSVSSGGSREKHVVPRQVPKQKQSADNHEAVPVPNEHKSLPIRIFSGAKLGKIKSTVNLAFNPKKHEDPEPPARNPPPPERSVTPEAQASPSHKCEACLRGEPVPSPTEPQVSRSFSEWQAGVPFKPPGSREPTIHEGQTGRTAQDLGLKLPCGHTAPYRVEPKIGDPVKRQSVSARRMKMHRGMGSSTIFTIQEAVPKAERRSPTESSAESEAIADRDVLKGLAIAVTAVCDEEVDALIREAGGPGVRKYLAGLTKIEGLGGSSVGDAKEGRRSADRTSTGLTGLRSGDISSRRTHGRGLRR